MAVVPYLSTSHKNQFQNTGEEDFDDEEAG